MKRIHMLAIIVIAFMLASVAVAYAQPKEPKLIKQKKFNSRIKKARGNVVVTDSELIFLDKDGNVKKTEKLKRNNEISLSEDGTRIGHAEYLDITEKGFERMKFKMMDENANILWETEGINGLIYVSPANGGTVVEQECFEGGCGKKITFRDKQKRAGKVLEPPVRKNAELADGYLSDDGNFFAAKYMIWDKFPELALFDVTINETLWVKKFDDEDLYQVQVSPHGKYVATIIRNFDDKKCWLRIYNKNGEEKSSLELALIGTYHLSFDKKEQNIVAASNNGNMYFISIPEAKLLWSYKAEKNLGFISVDNFSGFVAAGVTTENPDNREDSSLPRYLYVFNKAGILIHKKKFTGYSFRSWGDGPDVKLLNSGKKVRVAVGNDLMEFENESAR